MEVESEQILQIYEDRTHRERPNFGRVKEILAGIRQRGLVRIVEQDDKNFALFPATGPSDRGLEGHARFSRGVRVALRYCRG